MKPGRKPQGTESECSGREWAFGGLYKRVRNPTHGSGWIGSDPFYRHLLKAAVIPPTAVGGYFRSHLRELNNPPTTVGGILSAHLGFV